jgi:hypothetical protein
MTPRLATFTVFAINGAMIGTWVAHIPWLQDHLGISKATLGLCLLCMARGRARLDAADRPHPRRAAQAPR